MSWTIKRTDTFLECLSHIRGNKEALAELIKSLSGFRRTRSIQVGGFQVRCMVKGHTDRETLPVDFPPG
jgi:hypothetical protein